MLVLYVLLAVAALLFVAVWLSGQWLNYREAQAGSVRASHLRLRIEEAGYPEGGLSAIAQLEFRNAGQHAVKLTGQTQMLVNGKRTSNRIGYPTTKFYDLIAPAADVATIEIVADNIVFPSPNWVHGAVIYDFEYEIADKRARTSQKTAGKITFSGKTDTNNILGPVAIEFEVGPDVYDQYR
ncbi:hypothetical protein ACSVBT_12775 [Afipia sp. TerB]